MQKIALRNAYLITRQVLPGRQKRRIRNHRPAALSTEPNYLRMQGTQVQKMAHQKNKNGGSRIVLQKKKDEE